MRPSRTSTSTRRASLRNLRNNELLAVDGEIERLPQRILLCNTNTSTTTDVSYESSSTISTPDVSARYRDLDGGGAVVTDAKLDIAGLPPKMAGTITSVPDDDGRLGPRRRRLPRRRGPADRRGRLRGPQLRRAVAGARAVPQPRAAHRVRDPLRRRREPVRAPPAACWGSARRSSSFRARRTTSSTRRRISATASARCTRSSTSTTATTRGRRRGRPAHRDRHDARAAARTDPRRLQAVGRIGRPAAAVLRHVAQHGRRCDGGHRDGAGQRLRPGRGHLRDGAHRRRPDAARGAPARRGRDGLRPAPRRGRRGAAPRRAARRST